ncbi:MAG TPA: hypothetical protein VM141_01755, partial [Planctomycetota bacterium]|nr:hypothetical protein [Planctomycetota bacterium]
RITLLTCAACGLLGLMHFIIRVATSPVPLIPKPAPAGPQAAAYPRPYALQSAPAAITCMCLSAVAAFVITALVSPQMEGARAARGPLLCLTSSYLRPLVSLELAAVYAFGIAYSFSMGLGSLLVGRLLAGLQRDLSREQAQARETGEIKLEQVEQGIRHAGRLIGFFEAFIVTTLVALGQWQALGFIIAAKAIGRMKQMEERKFAEYFLIGTLANVSVSIIGGIAARIISGWAYF